jgi:hypothetical protein
MKVSEIEDDIVYQYSGIATERTAVEQLPPAIY